MTTDELIAKMAMEIYTLREQLEKEKEACEYWIKQKYGDKHE